MPMSTWTSPQLWTPVSTWTSSLAVDASEHMDISPAVDTCEHEDISPAVDTCEHVDIFPAVDTNEHVDISPAVGTPQLWAPVSTWTSSQLWTQVILEAWVKGVNPQGNSTNPSNWDFGSSFFFAGTVVTTIGYGNLAPSTKAGRAFCVFYALVGIPLNVVFLNSLGRGLCTQLATPEKWKEWPLRSQLLQVLGLGLGLTLGSLAILVFPPMAFSHVEGWSLSEGLYFTFITLSTIGFGDYVVGRDPSKLYVSEYRSLAALWILLALAWLALLFSLGPVLLHRCSRLWLLVRGRGLQEGPAPDPAELPRPPKSPISA
ncbi:potassium channel subfamily K member 16 isoform X1 [Cavia porcellus]|uniref:potassium channel subfamily K member 16 isoform X1 n=1 Tax=Cavia porcellus TaxID=10141 RepID=UPI002FDFC0E2